MGDEYSTHVMDVSEYEFNQAVLERSREVPVLVDFWAPWCGPCRTLGPVLEKLAIEFDGAFILVRVNTDENPNLAGQFGIRSIPNAWLFRDGQPVDQFIGALPETEVREFLLRHCPTEAGRMAAAGLEELETGEFEVARETFRKVMTLDPENPSAHLGLARLALMEGRDQEVEKHLAAIPPTASEAESARHVREALMFHQECQAAGGIEAIQKRLTDFPDDLEARFGLASCLAAAGAYREALEEFLAIVAKDKTFRDEGARKAMLTIFSIVGERSELADAYRNKLAWTLY